MKLKGICNFFKIVHLTSLLLQLLDILHRIFGGSQMDHENHVIQCMGSRGSAWKLLFSIPCTVSSKQLPSCPYSSEMDGQLQGNLKIEIR